MEDRLRVPLAVSGWSRSRSALAAGCEEGREPAAAGRSQSWGGAWWRAGGADIKRSPEGSVPATKVVGGFAGKAFEKRRGKDIREALMCHTNRVDVKDGVVGKLRFLSFADIVTILKVCRASHGVDG